MIKIIPAIDIIEGKCVRLTRGDFSKRTIYDENPLEVARQFEAHGLERLHIVDLDGARVGRVSNLSVLEKIAAGTNLRIDFGGGIKTDDDIRAVFDAGAAMAGIGSVAVKEPAKFDGWLEHYGHARILLGADVRDGRVAIDGWRTGTDLEILPFLKRFYARGVRKVFVTDIGRDGTLGGPALDLYAEILEHLPRLRLIASGGVESLDDVGELERIGCYGVIIGKAIYEDRISLTKLRSVARGAGNN